MDKRITLFTVAGPQSSELFSGEKSYGGWSYLIECIEFLELVCEGITKVRLYIGHHESFGPAPTVEQFKNVEVTILFFSESTLSNGNYGGQHGLILNAMLEKVKIEDNVYGVIDPDCYILSKDSFSEIVKLVDNGSYASIGVPYPSTLPKGYYWDFPVAYFQLFCRELVPQRLLDFRNDNSLDIVKRSAQPANKLIRLGYRVGAKFRTSDKALGQWLYRFFLNRLAGAVGRVTDTGFRNRLLFTSIGLKSKVLKTISIEKSIWIPGFNEDRYLEYNSDVRESGISPTWHYFWHGFFERRDIGFQPCYLRLFHSLSSKFPERREEHPANILLRQRSIFEVLLGTGHAGLLKHSQEFYWRESTFCVHLGHASKVNQSQNLKMLRYIREMVFGSRYNMSSDKEGE